jgi:hypothetical protein
MERVCRDTIPLTLVKDSTSSRSIYRRLDRTLYICTPNEVVDDTVTRIDMDDYLIDAVALFALAGIETVRAPSYMKMYWEIIGSNEQNLIDSDIANELVSLQDYVNDEEHYVIDKDDYEIAQGLDNGTLR